MTSQEPTAPRAADTLSPLETRLRDADKVVLGNWKMNGLLADMDVVQRIASERHVERAARTVLCGIAPPLTLLAPLSARLAAAGLTDVVLGAQDCHGLANDGAFTGDVSALMLREAGAGFVIVGHSERRSDHGETDAMVAAKAERALAAGLVAVICVGETAGQRARGLTLDVVARQSVASLPPSARPENTVIAYEPVWAIGTGAVAELVDIDAAHGAIRAALDAHRGADGAAFKVIYGGSVKPSNAAEILAREHVDGALVGGASLKAESFGPIIEAAVA